MSQADHSYRPDIDGLRAVAVAVVMAFHAFPSAVSGGFTGVDVFFVISGYLISGIILDAYADGRFTFANFYARRIRRIFPALIVVLAAVMAAGWFLLYADAYARVGRNAAASAGFAANFAFWRESSYFDVAADLKPLLHLWSLGVEEQFYLAWPLLLVASARWRRGPMAMTFVIGTISFLVAIWTVRIDRTPAFYAPWNRFWELLAGATLACVEADAQLNHWRQRLVSTKWLANSAALIGSIAIAVGVWKIDSTRVFPGLWVMLPVAGACLLIAAGANAWINRVILSHRAIVFVGLISYPLYLWHWPLLSFAHLVGRGAPSVSLRLGLLASSVILAWGTYQLIERPLRFGAYRRAIVPGLAASLMVVLVTALAIYRTDGVLDRAINRSNAAALVDYYDRVHKNGLADAYRSECDFMNWQTGETRTVLDPSCTPSAVARTIFLWGDSYAQALSRGIRENLPPGTALAQVTTSACSAAIEDFDLSVKDRRCERTNLYAMDAIQRLRPQLVLIAQQSDHAGTDWESIVTRVLALGAGSVVVIGPSPNWQPGLPPIYGEKHLDDHAEYVSEGIDIARFDSDRAAAARIKALANPKVTYLSLIEQLCPPSRIERVGETSRPACLARVPGEGELDLMVVDAGHLSPKGSSYLGRAIWKPFLDRVVR
jgi:peptidoglycan/LPS O-acetylase OafA/YrhL